MQLVNLLLQQPAHILAHSIRDIKSFGPPHEEPSIDADLIHRKTERKAQTENFLFPVPFRLGPGQHATNVPLIMLIVMLLEKGLNLFGQKAKQLLSRLRRHEILRNLHLILRQTKRGVTM